MNFTKNQLDIFDFVKSGKGHGIIDAVAGAGKTTTIIESARYVPENTSILFCAFNKAIATEISQRFQKKGMDRVQVKTIHALGYQMLRHKFTGPREIQIKENKYRQIIQDPASDEALQPYFERLLDLNNYPPFNELDDKRNFGAKRFIYNAKERLLSMVHKYRTTLMKDDADSFRDMVLHYSIFSGREAKTPTFNPELKHYLECLRYYIQRGNEIADRSLLIDFADMLYLPYVWNLQPKEKFDFVFIDECQDLSRSQIAIALKYCLKTCRVLAVGDPRQSIYGFNGADIESFDKIKKQFEPMEPLSLTTSFRCPKSVIKLATEIRPDITGSKTEEGIVRTIEIHKVAELAVPGDLIISRVKAPLLILVFTFIDKDIKVRIHDDEADSFIEELKKLFKQEQLQIRLSKHPGGFDQLKEDVINRWTWIIEKEAEKIDDSTERNLHIITETAFLERKVEFLHKKYVSWKSRCDSVLEILKVIKEYISFKDNPITLSTIHRAKGLENRRVFILNYDLMPYYRDGMQDWEWIQEVNLKYVALTRALEELYLVKAEKMEELIDEGSLFDDYPLID